MSDNKTFSWLHQVQIVAVNLSLTVVGLVVIFSGVYYVYKENATMAATSIGTGLVLLFAATIDRFESLKGLGMEAKTRRLNATIDKAEVALAQMKKLTEIAGAELISLSSKSGRMSDTPSFEESYGLVKNVKGLLRAVDSDNLAIKNALRPWIQLSATLLLMNQLRPVERALNDALVELGKNISAVELAQPKDLTEHASLIRRRDTARAYLNEKFHTIFYWDFGNTKETIRAFINDTPELRVEDKMRFLDELSPAVTQVEYLISELDFKDPEFWKRNMVDNPRG